MLLKSPRTINRIIWLNLPTFQELSP